MKEAFFVEKGIYYRTNDLIKERKTLVFIHGLSGSSSAWRVYEDAFSREYNFVSFDLRGHGKSEKPPKYEDYEMANFVSDTKALLDFLGIGRAILVAHSFGGLIAIEYALMYPDSVVATILLSPDFPVLKTASFRTFYPLVALCKSLSEPLFMFHKHGGRHVDYSLYKKTGDWNVFRIVADVSNTGLRPYFYCLKQMCRFDDASRLSEITAPTLIFHGTKDSMVPYENSVELTRKIKNSQLVTLQDANHITILNNSSEIIKVIHSFISSL